MLDWKKIVNEPQSFVDGLSRRNISRADVEARLASIDRLAKQRVEILKQVEDLKATKNRQSQDVPRLMKEGKKDEAQKIIEGGKQLSVDISNQEKHLERFESELNQELEMVPNIPDTTVPNGKGAQDNVEVKSWGAKRQFDFEPLSHDEWGEKTGLIDFARAAKVSGARFVYLRGDLARLERALLNYMLDRQQSNGYQETAVPFLVSSKALFASGQLPKFREDLFKVEDQDKFLIPTTEVPLNGLFIDEILDEAQLPIKLCGSSMNFRSEAGSYGKDTRGMIRQHQFYKVELFQFAHPHKSFDALESMVCDAESVMEGLGLPYRRMLLCSGDMGFASVKTYDLEVWLPGSVHEGASKGCYREISSCSNCGDFQARRSQIRYRDLAAKKTQLVHTLNGSGLAVGRCLVAVIENFQNKDLSLTIPSVLRPYMGGQEKISPPK